MKHFGGEVRIEVPVEQAWAVMCDTTRWKEFLPRAELSDISGPVDEVGTTYVQSERFLGFEVRVTMTVVEVEPQRL